MNERARHFLEQVLERRDLSQPEAGELLHLLTDPALPPAVAGAVLAGLRMKGVTPAEVRGFACAMRELGRKPELADGLDAIDIVGTGGDSSGSLNLSTGAALLSAAAGLPVIKHGNRSISSRSGSADLIERLGIPMPLNESAARRCFEATGFTFLFAPYYHPAMKALAPVRAALGVRTVFNLLGPLTNPGSPRFYLIGAFSVEAARLIAEAIAGMQIARAWVTHGAHGWDEATPIGPFHVFDVRGERVTEELVDPQAFGLARVAPAALAGGDSIANLAALRAVFERRDTGAHLDALALQSGIALHIAGRAASVPEGIETARATVASGRAADWLQRLQQQRGVLGL